jgi:hypothetical protein
VSSSLHNVIVSFYRAERDPEIKKLVIKEVPDAQNVYGHLQDMTEQPIPDSSGTDEKNRFIKYRLQVKATGHLRDAIKKGLYVHVVEELHPDVRRMVALKQPKQYVVHYVSVMHHDGRYLNLGLTEKDQ